MLENVIEVEEWLHKTTDGFQKLTALFRIPMKDTNREYFLEETRTLIQLLDKYRDADFIVRLENELQIQYGVTNKVYNVNRYVRYVISMFEDFWVTAQKFEELYISNNYNGELGDLLYEVRLFVKHETWDSDPYNFNSTIFSILNDYYKPGQQTSYTNSPDKGSQSSEPGVKLQWKGDKADLAEVVYALYKSERITDTSTGKDVTKKLLAKQLGDLFCIDLTDMETPMKGRRSSYKAHYDGKTFTRYLAQIVDNFIKII